MTREHAAAAIAAVTLVAAACQNQVQAPGGEGPGGAALNVGLGAAVAPLHRAATGCYTPCAYGTVCDEASGTCVSRECTAGEPDCAIPAPTAASGAPPPASAAAATPICTPGCLAEELCVLEAGRSVCRRTGSAPPPATSASAPPALAPRVPAPASSQGAKPAR